ncbi:ABC transporter ATP-binding protein [Stenotrophomonas geniculata]|jgi:lipopolysaccharide transport system ATP-binding protein|uniref:ABC transporter ATP-binding protein n=2 Tax=Stenotrophomonas TaxID=40323 RepID=A0ABW1N5B5_9GAMM|nr:MULTISPECIES: ABC transporter ATP-binding protein [Stenotrophomonas]MBH1639329.1 ABC transporter ATP-binding protein [Stenotrophomonas maltophilia]MCI1066536.1 ABC transporter ATP-binding protein [Stenotrophomonas maltophilia]MCI1091429.1 ABC transporter ATP-binding protein [Stenotrophomonas maltophilia]MCI1107656.1 ABC transporter ATP-binding protein [Stenotrophomonas maltophilia]MCI1129328.1 ABC transporter ATP-binding protein [Stenotrophomonas maltophilia]
MSSENAIEVESLSKCYQIYDKPRDRLMQMLLGNDERRFYREFWALRDVSFKIPKGQVYGILGKNGAGKSTLLQIICGTLAATSGEARVAGRVSALLELGSGFNPEFTGIENIYMNAQLLGLTRKEVDGKLDKIISFADIGDHVSQPVKTYSSGMFARLAFSVAIHVDPDILIVDETLSVGDAWFQHKSMARMRKLMESGCTVLFVSHSIDAVRALCDYAIWIDGGTLKMQGNVTEVTNAYMNDVFVEHNRLILEASQGGIHDEPGSVAMATPTTSGPADQAGDDMIDAEEVTARTVLNVQAVQLLNTDGQPTDQIEQRDQLTLAIDVKFYKALKNVSIGFLIKDQFGQELTGESIFNSFRKGVEVYAGQLLQVRFRGANLLRGGQSYSIAIRINQVSHWDRSDNVVIYADELAAVFDVRTDKDEPMWFKFRMPFKVECK